jgi:hypothetical protein
MLGAESAVVILDDTEGVWPRHFANLIQVSTRVCVCVCVWGGGGSRHSGHQDIQVSCARFVGGCILALLFDDFSALRSQGRTFETIRMELVVFGTDKKTLGPYLVRTQVRGAADSSPSQRVPEPGGALHPKKQKEAIF